MMSVKCVAIFWVVNASSGEKSCLKFSILTGSGVRGEGGISHRLRTFERYLPRVSDRIICMALCKTLSETRLFTRKLPSRNVGEVSAVWCVQVLLREIVPIS